MKKQIIITHYDKNIDPESFIINGKTDKDLILDFYKISNYIIYLVGENDNFLNDVYEGEYTDDELKNKISFNTLDEFIKFIEKKSDYSITVKEK